MLYPEKNSGEIPGNNFADELINHVEKRAKKLKDEGEDELSEIYQNGVDASRRLNTELEEAIRSRKG